MDQLSNAGGSSVCLGSESMGAGLREETGSHFFAMSNPPDEFIKPGSLSVKRLKVKEGPTPVWIVWRPDVAQGVGGDDAEAFSRILKLCRWPASTPTGQALREWLEAWGYERPGKTPKAPDSVPDDKA